MKTILLAAMILILTGAASAGDRFVMGSGIAGDEATAVQNAINSIDCDGALKNMRVTVHKNGNFYNAEVSATCHTENSNGRLVNVSAASNQTAPSASQSAGTLANLCAHSASITGDLDKVDAADGYCVGVVTGLRLVIDSLPVLTPGRKTQLHIDPTASNAQLIRVFVAYVKAHPEYENKNMFIVWAWALQDAELMNQTSAQ